jgi:hypothetical protein
MLATVTTFKASGKWYDEFEMDIPDYIKPFEAHKIMEIIESTHPQCKEFNYTLKIDDGTNWQRYMKINTHSPKI